MDALLRIAFTRKNKTLRTIVRSAATLRHACAEGAMARRGGALTLEVAAALPAGAQFPDVPGASPLGRVSHDAVLAATHVLDEAAGPEALAEVLDARGWGQRRASHLEPRDFVRRVTGQ